MKDQLTKNGMDPRTSANQLNINRIAEAEANYELAREATWRLRAYIARKIGTQNLRPEYASALRAEAAAAVELADALEEDRRLG